jgi:hypothetical protein
MEIESETIPSSPSTVLREIDIILIAPIDITRDITMGHKRHAQDLQNSVRRQRDIQVPQGTP